MEDFMNVAQTGELIPGATKLVAVDDEQIVLANLDGTVVAFTNVCTQSGCDLTEGQLEGEELECELPREPLQR